MKNIADLRAALFAQLTALEDSSKPVDSLRVRAMVALSEQIIDSARLEVQLAAVMKGSLDVPFIEAQAGERQPSNDPSVTPQIPAQTPLERAASVLASGPSANHPWRAQVKK